MYTLSFGYFFFFVVLTVTLLSGQPAWAENRNDQFVLDDIFRGNGSEYLDTEYLDSLIYGNVLSLDEEIKIALLSRQMEAYMSVGAYNKAVHAYELLCEVADNGTGEPDNVKAELNYGSTLLYTGRYVEAYSVAFSVLAKAKLSGNLALKADALLLLANISIRTNELNLAYEYLAQTNDILNKLGNNENKQVLQFRYLLGMSALEISKKEYSNAYEYIKKAEKTCVEPDSMPYTLNMNIAIIYDFLHNDQGAELYYKKIVESPKSHYNKYIAINNYAYFLLRRNRSQEAIALLNDNITALKSMGASHALAQTYTLLFNAYFSMGDFRAAAESAQSAMPFFNEIMNEHFKLQHDQIACIHENNQLKKDLVTNISQVESLMITAFVIQLLLGSVFCSAVYLIRRRRKRMNAINARIFNIRNSHIDDSLRIVALEEAVNHKNRELVSCKLRISQYEQTFSDLSKPDNSASESGLSLVSSVMDKVKSLNHTKANWDAMKLYFEEIYPDFYIRLDQKHPNLTRGERRMSAFIISGMNTSEIADLCRRSPRTIESIKYQMKKKLGLPPEESLEKYLNTLK